VEKVQVVQNARLAAVLVLNTGFQIGCVCICSSNCLVRSSVGK